ncbi:transcriptional regulator (plasmid) [Paraburkholderia caffeinilytica]|uniref:Hydrogen peroxide-inducible genes activator n=2 Tax=Paraburkholderia TaxID=1822464 RepID=A0A6J5FPK6_9BURK|nr:MULTISPECIES: LysR family transcriptional regulator [Paraburkholderia]AXL53952.1 transcriptional regulator [Paraburkholderia caffeinilytica]GGC65026.1 LysR family transcriptional regulator [Paraburkholderia caffeinilytica]CAB3781939.1 Hydrogen peroxide-inducible genes activator [Paraburkholderia caffeinitolerans]CAB3802516.1 Hydrogen peroxide-inducible genes activator [Paraburkholderia caffeinilytica]
MFIRQLKYLVTLATEQHFAKAAEICNVSQPALSSAIQSLEAELGLALVKRGRRFLGFTEEGERVLGWARQTLAALENMRQDASASQVGLNGTLRFGFIPTTLPIVGLLLGPCRAKYGEMSYTVRSLSSEAILRQLDEYEIDIGFTYLDERVQAGFEVLPLYRERYFLLSPANKAGESRRSAVQWAALANLPFCLLSTAMQNRQVINAAFRRAGIQPNVVLETDSLLALHSNVQHAGMYSVLPHSLLSVLDDLKERRVRAVRIEPELTREIGLITRNKPSMQPLVTAMWTEAVKLDLQHQFDSLLSGSKRVAV